MHLRIRYFATAAVLALCVSALRAAGADPAQNSSPLQAPPAAEPPAAQPAPPPQPAITRVVAVGDIMLGGTARPVMVENGYDHAFREVRPLLDGAQVVFGNLEGPLTDRGTPDQEKTYVFRSPPAEVAAALVGAGFNVVSLGNNHSMDYGPEGLAQTIEALDAAGIAHAGAGMNLAEARRPAILAANGKRIAVLSYSLTLPETFFAAADKPGTAFGHEEHVRADVAAARQHADIVLVSCHWGQEGKTQLRDYQVRIGRAAIEAGAAAVIGHHPHILQAVERYRDGVILYSLGNFAFGSYSKTAQVSAVAELSFEENTLRSLRLRPIDVNNLAVNFQSRPLNGGAAQQVVDTLIALSRERNTMLLSDGGVAVLDLASEVRVGAAGSR